MLLCRSLCLHMCSVNCFCQVNFLQVISLIADSGKQTVWDDESHQQQVDNTEKSINYSTGQSMDNVITRMSFIIIISITSCL